MYNFMECAPDQMYEEITSPYNSRGDRTGEVAVAKVGTELRGECPPHDK